MRTLVATTAMFLASASAAWAHAMLEHASPGAGAELAAAPRAVTLAYSQQLEPAFCAVAVTDSAGRDVTAGAVDAHDSTMAVPLKALRPGTYRVSWHAVSIDTHRTEGAFTFTVKP
jgi:methionine-rich copper-binding protein CopC